MKNLFLIFSIAISGCLFSQSQYTVEQVENSNDPKLIANFIKFNPDHPKTPLFKQKLYDIITTGDSETAKPAVTPLNASKLKTEVKKDIKTGKIDAHTQKTVALLNHLFNSNPNSNEAYVQIENKSKCNMIVKISGNKFYNLDVKAHDQNFILVEKGTYTLTTDVCDAKYSSVKNINKDTVITLNSNTK